MVGPTAAPAPATPFSGPIPRFEGGAAKSCVIALHCSLGSRRQWTQLAEQLGGEYRVIAPDISGYGEHERPINPPMSLAEEVALMSDSLPQSAEPVHLIGHSYGGAIAFKIATQSPFASRVRSLTLIEPVLPTLLDETAADRRLRDGFAGLAREIHQNLCNGHLMEALDKFTDFWNGSGPPDHIPAAARLRMIERVQKLAFDFAAILAEENVSASAAAIRAPTLLFSGGLSPYMTQRVVARLAAAIIGAETMHLPAAGHMLAFSHADQINPRIISHIRSADGLTGLSHHRRQVRAG